MSLCVRIPADIRQASHRECMNTGMVPVWLASHGSYIMCGASGSLVPVTTKQAVDVAGTARNPW